MSKNSYPTRSQIARRRGVALTAVTAAAATGIVYAAAGNSTPAPKPEPKVTCEVPVGSGDTLSGLANQLGIGQAEYSAIDVYRGNHKEKNPDAEMQPGDAAVALVGNVACKNAGGIPINPDQSGAN